ncbi:hypothetical protein SH203_02850 [Brevundimonas sp. SH203]|uniref:hypothetical protein n=1 Tax=Brevundimonas sp. SH203 TaxID=345167 RepID=UPI0009D436C3|nr:hypothetical protein [Brevundimonas sp. SH203]GAW42434.1 hypothetical protein SH203_02850 [Brevundimonas sp. SH203]
MTRFALMADRDDGEVGVVCTAFQDFTPDLAFWSRSYPGCWVLADIDVDADTATIIAQARALRVAA